MITYDFDLALREATALYQQEQIFLLVDENTRRLCLPELQKTLTIPEQHILCLPAGETNKTLASVQHIWDFLIRQGATRQSLLLILGGGVLTDMGGFAASCFKRGIAYVNIPTTLLAAVDAAAGGKTGFDYQGLKNEIGLFSKAAATIVYPAFFETLPIEQLLSGYAEMLKHALISSPLELVQVLAFDWNAATLDWQRLSEILSRSIDIKNYIVEQDPEEHDLRKTLNFGHTVGHAIESYALQKGEPILHGYAVAYGIVAELYLSVTKFGFPQNYFRQVVSFVTEHYGKPVCPCKDYDRLISLMQHDKKNQSVGEINCTLLRNVGNYQLNQHPTREEVLEALDFLFNQ